MLLLIGKISLYYSVDECAYMRHASHNLHFCQAIYKEYFAGTDNTSTYVTNSVNLSTITPSNHLRL